MLPGFFFALAMSSSSEEATSTPTSRVVGALATGATATKLSRVTVVFFCRMMAVLVTAFSLLTDALREG